MSRKAYGGRVRLDKRGLMLQTLIGIIIGAVILIAPFSLIGSELSRNRGNEEDFRTFHQQVAAIADEPKGAIQTPQVDLDPGNALIGLNPRMEEEERNGRLGDGDLHLILNKAWDKSTFTTPGKETSGGYQDALHFKRPGECAEEETCLCLCEGASINTTVAEDYKEGLDVDIGEPLQPLYTNDLWQEAYLRELDEQATLECERVQCEQVSGATIATPLTAFDFKQRPEEADNPLFNILESTKKKELPFLIHENGFLIYRAREKKDKPFTYGHYDFLPESFPTTIAKLEQGRIAVCLTRECLDRIAAYEVAYQPSLVKGPDGEFIAPDGLAEYKCNECTGDEEDLIRETCISFCEEAGMDYPPED